MESGKLFERVLLVEDEPAHAMLTKRALGAFAHQVLHAATLAQAESLAMQGSYDLVVTDLYVPDGSKAQLVDRLRQALPQVPIVVLTSSTALADAVEAMKVGARDFIVKNFDKDFPDVLGFALTRLWTALDVEAARRRLERDMALLRVAIESAPDGLAVVNDAGEIQYSNQSFQRAVRSAGGEGKSLFDWCTDHIRKKDELRSSFDQKLKGLEHGAVWSTEIVFAQDKHRAFDLTLSALESEESAEAALKRRAFVIWVRDVSDQRRREHFQREMLSTTTHDLKGPLGAITLSAELLSGLVKDIPKAAELSLRISSSAHGAINLIDEFLSARRIQEGSFLLRPQLHQVQPLCEEVLGNFSPIAASKGVVLDVPVIAPELQVMVDRLGFIRVVGNLLSNAIKFTPKGGRVRLEVEQRPDEVVVRVTDSGSGMEPSEVQRIFGRFGRLERHSGIQGTGLGLFVVKNVVQAHGGKVVVTSALGKGSTFEVTFPHHPPMDERGQVIALDFG